MPEKSLLISNNSPAERRKRRRHMMVTWLRALNSANEPLEIFMKPSGTDNNQAPLTGYYDIDHLELLVRDVEQYLGKADVYYRVNTLRQDVLARGLNRLQAARKGVTSTAADIIRRRFLFIDVDTRREANASATKVERQGALATAKSIADYLQGLGWPPPATINSGNGIHLMFRANLPANDNGLIEDVLRALAAKFDVPGRVEVDLTVGDAARLARLPGTVNCKGEVTIDRPRWLCRLVSLPKKPWPPVPEQLLRQLSPPLRAARQTSSTVDSELKSLIARANKYVSKMDPAISGRGGHNQTFKVACRLVIGFGLDTEQALPIIAEFNNRCQPPWSEDELRRKIEQAAATAAFTGQPRGRLRTRKSTVSTPYVGWEPLAGKEFLGWLPDFADAAAIDVLGPLTNFERQPWHFWVDYYLGWRLLVSDPAVPDVMLRQLYWGAQRPRNWQRELRKWRDQSLIEAPGAPSTCTRENCLFAASGTSHRHYPTQITQWGFLQTTLKWPEQISGETTEDSEFDEIDWHPFDDEDGTDQDSAPTTLLPADEPDLVPNNGSPYPPADRRYFPLRDNLCKELLTKARGHGEVVPVYMPALLLGASPRVGWTAPQQRLLLGIAREVTRVERRSAPFIFRGNRVITAGNGSGMVACPQLDLDQHYVTFGGNGRRSGRGYQIIGRTFGGWLRRAGYRREDEDDNSGDLVMVRCFLRDVARLAEDLDLIVVGYHPGHPSTKWRGIENLLSCLRTGAGREWLSECTLRIYAPADFLIRWRYFFSRKLGFRWIPNSIDDPGPVASEPEMIDAEFGNGDQVRRWLRSAGFTQSRLAEMLTDRRDGKYVSRQRINKLVNGHGHDAELLRWIDFLRRDMGKQ